MFVEAITEIESEAWDKDAGIVIGRETWSSGIVGILAGKLAEHFQRPVIAIGFDGECGHGSVRGPRGFHLYDILQGLSDCLVRFGGHQAAAGLDVRVDDIGVLRTRFSQACGTHSDAGQRMSGQDEPAALQLDSNDDFIQVARDLSLFEPCGEGNRQPRASRHGPSRSGPGRARRAPAARDCDRQWPNASSIWFWPWCQLPINWQASWKSSVRCGFRGINRLNGPRCESNAFREDEDEPGAVRSG